MTISDINSTEIGSGARFNSGKPPLELIPVWIIADCARISKSLPASDYRLESALTALGKFQMSEGSSILLEQAVCYVGPAWNECAQVFDYGRKKYAEWNWLKGMPWSVVIGCAARHLTKMLEGEELDPESGLPHRGHLLCNLVMLITYAHTYPEGDDRPKVHLRDVAVRQLDLSSAQTNTSGGLYVRSSGGGAEVESHGGWATVKAGGAQ